MSGYDVEVENLTSTGDAFVDLADEAREAYGEFSGQVQVHDGANEGFTTTSKAQSLANSWEYYVEDMSKRTAVAGGLLQEAGQGYRQMEDDVIETLPPLGSGD